MRNIGNIAEIPELNKLTDAIITIISETRGKYDAKCKEYQMALENAENDVVYGQIKTKLDDISRIPEITISSSHTNYFHADNLGLPAFVIDLNTYLGEFNLQGWILENNKIGLNYYQGKDTVMAKFLDCMIKHAEEKYGDISLCFMKKSDHVSIHSAIKDIPVSLES